MLMCSRCHKRPAVVFISQSMDTSNSQGLCLVCAKELGINFKQGYNGDLSSRDNGYVGGYMVKRLIEQAERQMASQGGNTMR